MRRFLMFLSLVQQRRSIRRYQEKPVEADKIDRLIEIALRSPSSRGFNPWEFIVVTDPNLLDKLSKAKPHGASFLKKAPLGIVVCADPEKCDTDEGNNIEREKHENKIIKSIAKEVLIDK